MEAEPVDGDSMTPVKRPACSAAAIAAALLALLSAGAAPAPAMLHPEPRSVPASGPGSPLREGDRVVAEVRFDHGAIASLDDLRSAGARVLAASRRLQTVTVAARPSSLRALGAVDGAVDATTVPAPIVSAVCGSVQSEGDTQLAAAEARADFGLDGSGVTVGILSDSFDTDPAAATRAATDVASGDLPGASDPCGHSGPVGVFDDSVSEEAKDEGRGMAQIVHDLAPGAKIEFATAFRGEAAFAASIRDLAAAGANVIVDDVAYFEEPFFQDGPVAVAISEVTAEGVSYFTATGNDNLIAGGKDIASWETPEFRDAAHCPAQLKAATGFTEHCLDFDPGNGPGREDSTFGISVEEGAKLDVDLQWAEPWNGVETDLDAYLLDSTGKPIADGTALVGSTEDNVAPKGTERPVEYFSWENKGPETEVQLVVNRCFGKVADGECNDDASSTAKPRLKVILLENGKGVTATEYPASSPPDVVGPTIFGHAGAPAAVSVGAIQVGVSSAPERYSSRGPVTHYFGPVTGVSPAPAIDETIEKPDVVASDCGRTTFFLPTSTAGIYRFCGTSAAAPHAAAIAALARQANPALTQAQLRGGLSATARPVGSFGPNAVGAGILDAHALVEGVALPPAISILSRPAAVGRNRSPSIAFGANRPVSFACSIDGGALQPCSSPYTPPEPLADGLHGFAVRGEDLAGRVGVSPTISFRVDTVPPRTSFRRKPRKLLRTRRRLARAVFVLASNEPESRFTCRVDGGLVHFCRQRLVRRFKAGSHVLRATAVDAAGNVDRTPATFRFTVKRVGRASRSR
jgi:hypothetical protein